MTHCSAFSRRICFAALALLVAGVAGIAQGKDTILRLWLTGPVLEAPDPALEFEALFGAPVAGTLYELVSTIEHGAESSRIDGLVLIVDGPLAGPAQIEEIRRAIGHFKARGKPVYAYLDTADNIGYLIASAADHVTIAEHSTLEITGLWAEMVFFKGLMDKIGLKADLLQVGDYKSAVEPYTRTSPSDAARENMNWLLDGVYERYLAMIADGRDIPLDAARAAVDAAPLSAAEAYEAKLVDEVSSFAAFRQMVHKKFGADVEVLKSFDGDGQLDLDIDMENPFQLFQLFREAFEKTTVQRQDGVGLIYIDGPITLGLSNTDLFSATSAGSTTIRAALHEALADDAIKAVVLRVNSPGGSALASDIIWKAATRVGKVKPLIVSMGDVAGSGGYYVAVPGDRIFAEAPTITGSIGVLGGKLVWRGLLEEKLGITSTEFTRGKQADLFSPMQPFSDTGRAEVRELLERTYSQFKERIRSSRGQRLNGDLDQLGGGRVFTGQQARERGLIDEVGGLSDALAYAAREAGLTDPEVYVLPEQGDFAQELIARLLGGERGDEFEINAGRQSVHVGNPQLWRVLRDLLPRTGRSAAEGLLNLLIVDAERVSCYAPLRVRF